MAHGGNHQAEQEGQRQQPAQQACQASHGGGRFRLLLVLLMRGQLAQPQAEHRHQQRQQHQAQARLAADCQIGAGVQRHQCQQRHRQNRHQRDRQHLAQRGQPFAAPVQVRLRQPVGAQQRLGKGQHHHQAAELHQRLAPGRDQWRHAGTQTLQDVAIAPDERGPGQRQHQRP